MRSLHRYIGLLWLFGSHAAAAAPLHFRVCSHELPPHTMKLPGNQAGGMASEILLAVATRLDWQLQVIYQPWLRTRDDAETGKCDLIYTILDKPEYRAFAIFPKQYLSERKNVLVSRKSSKLRYDGDLQAFMQRHSIGTYRDKAVSPLFDQLKLQPWARLDYANTAEDNLRKLLVGRFDAAVENSATAIYELKKLGALDQAEILEPPLLITPAYVAFSKRGRATAYVEDFDRELKAFKATPAYASIVARYEGMLD